MSERYGRRVVPTLLKDQVSEKKSEAKGQGSDFADVNWCAASEEEDSESEQISLESILMDDGVIIGKTSSSQRASMRPEELERRNAEIAVEMDKMSFEYDRIFEVNGTVEEEFAEDLSRIDEIMDELALESDYIEEILEVKYNRPGGGRVFSKREIFMAAKEGMALGKILSKRNCVSKLDEDKEIQLNEPPKKQSKKEILDIQWEEKFEEASQKRQARDLWSTPLLSRLNRFYETQYGEYQEKMSSSKIEDTPKSNLKKLKRKRAHSESLKKLDSLLDSGWRFGFDTPFRQFDFSIDFCFPDDFHLIQVFDRIITEKYESNVYFEIISDNSHEAAYPVIVLSLSDLIEVDELIIPIQEGGDLGYLNQMITSMCALTENGIALFETVAKCKRYCPAERSVSLGLTVSMLLSSQWIKNGGFRPKQKLLVKQFFDLLDIFCEVRESHDMEYLNDARMKGRLNSSSDFDPISNIDEIYDILRPTWSHMHDNPANLLLHLSDYQKRALSWLVNRENNQENCLIELIPDVYIKLEISGLPCWISRITGMVEFEEPKCMDITGGILADEMGLGKTIEIIALILANPLKTWSVLENRLRKDYEKYTGVLQSYVDLGTPYIESCATLVICPMNIISQWVTEISTHSTLTYFIYDGHKQCTHLTVQEIASYDIVLTSLDVFKSEVHLSVRMRYGLRFQKEYKPPESFLLSIYWWRVVIDEAQFIESTISSASLMAGRLSAKNRWGVTGTPLGKKGLWDLFGLITFLKVHPLDVKSVWEEVISKFGKCTSDSFLIRLLKKLMWRQCKAHVHKELEVPPRNLSIVRLSFSVIEQEYYRRLCSDIASRINLSEASPDADYKSALLSNAMVDELRQACCHPAMRSSIERSQNDSLDSFGKVIRDMMKQAQGELSSKEREYCRLLNLLGQAEYNCGFVEKAQTHWISSWRICDGGIDFEEKRVEISSTSIRLIPTPQIIQTNAQIKEWRKIELVTCVALQNLFKATLNEDKSLSSEAMKDLKDNLKLLENQIQDCVNSISELDKIKLDNQEKLIVSYKTNILAFLRPSICVGVLHDFIKDFQSLPLKKFIQKNRKGIKNIEKNLVVEKKVISNSFAFVSFIKTKFQISELLQLIDTNSDVYFKKQLVIDELRSQLLQIKQTPFKRDSKILISPIISVLRNELNILMKDLNNLQRRSALLDKSIDQNSSQLSYFENIFPIWQQKFMDISDTLTLLRNFKELCHQWYRLRNYKRQYKKALENIYLDCDMSLKLDPEIEIEHLRRNTFQVQFQCISKGKHLKRLQSRLEEACQNSRELAIEEIAYDGTQLCSICREIALDPIITYCCHLFCKQCLATWLEKSSTCAVCRLKLAPKQMYSILQPLAKPHTVSDVIVRNPGLYGTKIEAVLLKILELEKNIDQGTSDRSFGKHIVFSQFIPLLKLLQKALQENCILGVILDGDPKNRAGVLKKFKDDIKVRVMLMSLRKDASGLTLLSAQHVFLLEPSTNFAVEDQVIFPFYVP